MKVKAIMVQPVIVVRQDTTLEEAARLMLDHDIGGLPVINAQGRLTGIITESDFTGRECGIPFSTFRAPKLFGQWLSAEGLEEICRTARSMQAQDIMTPDVITVTENDTVEHVVELMLHHHIHRLPVVRDDVPVGMVTRRDLLKLMQPGKTD